MSVLSSRPVLRWLVPVAATAAVIGGGIAVGALAAAADPSLPKRSAAELLVDLQTARLDGLSGTVVQRADLGLPALPNLGGQGSSDLTSLIAGTHTLRVWYSGPDKARVALLGALGESDVITNGTDVWTWSSKENKATHRKLTGEDKHTPAATPSVSGMNMTPQQLANLALAAINPSTIVSTEGSAQVAGRDAYELVLAPRDPGSLLKSVRLAIDATEHVPLRVQVYARGSDAAAIEVAFTQVSFARPDDQQFTFNPPPGAQIQESTDTAKSDTAKPDGAKSDAGKSDAGKPGPTMPDLTMPGLTMPGLTMPGLTGSADAQAGRPAIIGSGWTSVIVARLPEPATDAADPKAPTAAGPGGDAASLTGLLKSLPAVSGAWGSGHLLTSKLFSALVTDDGRVVIGAVSPDRLYQALSDPKAKLGS